MSLPEPRANPLLFGHAAAEAALIHATRTRLHHAWLLSGAGGVGKRTLAYRFARWLLAGASNDTLAVDPAHPTFRRVAAGSHADLLTVARAYDEKRQKLRQEIVVDDVRAIPGFLRLTAAEGGWRVVVVEGAEALNRNAANAVLKILEEPPPQAVLLVTCAAPGRLLPTIRSRCRHLALPPLDAATMGQGLDAALPDLDPPARAALIPLAQGSLGRALMLAEDGVATAALVHQVLGAVAEGRTPQPHPIADGLTRGDAFSIFMDLLRDELATILRRVARGTGSAADHRLADRRPLARWGDVWHALGVLQDETERLYLDKRQAVVSGLALLAADA